jgi:uncharacterized protein (DUF1501 family)
MHFTRRSFLRTSFGAAPLAAFGATHLTRLAFAADSAAAADRDLLVSIFLRGGCDGLNFVAPVDDPHYLAARPPEMRIQQKGERAGLSLEKGFAGADWRIHKEAAPLHEFYAHGDLAIVHACGLVNASRSHFDAQDMMERGIADQKNLGLDTGWLSRVLAAIPAPGLLPGVAPAGTLPVSMLGTDRACGIADLRDFAYWGDQNERAVLHSLQSLASPLTAPSNRALALIEAIQKRLPRDKDGNVPKYQPGKGVHYPEHDFSDALQTVAWLAKLDVGLQVAAVDYGDWDTHTGQDYRFAEQVRNLAGPLAAFYRDLSDRAQHVTVVVMSEFGRRLKANESGGTDHGHGNIMLVLGKGIRGGRLHGTWPGLANDQLDQHADLAITTDYRQVLAEVLNKRLKCNASEIFPSWSATAPLGLV